MLGILAGTVVLIFNRPPGSAFAWYVGAYATLRFLLEFLRGDPDRRTLLGFTEAQWTSLVLSVGGGLFSPWCRVAAGLLLLCMTVQTALRSMRTTPHHRLLHPRHVREVAEALVRTRARGLRVESTSLGIRISAGTIPRGNSLVEHYALSSHGEPLNRQAAQLLARLVLRLRYRGARASELIAGKGGVFHLLVPSRREG